MRKHTLGHHMDVIATSSQKSVHNTTDDQNY